MPAFHGQLNCFCLQLLPVPLSACVFHFQIYQKKKRRNLVRIIPDLAECRTEDLSWFRQLKSSFSHNWRQIVGDKSSQRRLSQSPSMHVSWVQLWHWILHKCRGLLPGWPSAGAPTPPCLGHANALFFFFFNIILTPGLKNKNNIIGRHSQRIHVKKKKKFLSNMYR